MARRRRLAEQSPSLEETLRGTVRRRFVRCGKAGCRCRRGKGHGPVLYLSVTLGVGRTRQITIRPEAAALARGYVRNYQRLWQFLERIWAVNRELFQHRLLPDVRARLPASRRSRPKRARS